MSGSKNCVLPEDQGRHATSTTMVSYRHGHESTMSYGESPTSMAYGFTTTSQPEDSTASSPPDVPITYMPQESTTTEDESTTTSSTMMGYGNDDSTMSYGVSPTSMAYGFTTTSQLKDSTASSPPDVPTASMPQESTNTKDGESTTTSTTMMRNGHVDSTMSFGESPTSLVYGFTTMSQHDKYATSMSDDYYDYDYYRELEESTTSMADDVASSSSPIIGTPYRIAYLATTKADDLMTLRMWSRKADIVTST